jgi:4-amino-4-deoxy-L-arabinose transferase-like glycosyltransferase
LPSGRTGKIAVAARINRWLWLLLTVFAVVWFGNIEYRKLIKPDEGRYAEIPREMVASGDWVTPRLNGLKYFEKPPLQYWTTAAAYEVFGEHQWTSRLWVSLTGFAGVLLVWFAGTRLFGRDAGRYAAMLLGSSMLYALMGHINTLDMGVTFFMTLGIVALLLAQQEDEKHRARWMWLAWSALGFAVLSKGLIGLVLPGAALVIYSALQRDIGVWKRMHWIAGLSLFLLVTVPWFYLVMKANPEFFQKFFIYEHFTRFTTKQLGRYQPWYYFVPVLLFGMLPWTLQMLDVVLGTWRNSVRADRLFNPERFLLVWLVFIYVFFTISDSKLPSYLLPMFPALALLMGRQMAVMSERRLFWQLLPVLPVLVILLGISAFASRFGDTAQQVRLYGEYAHWLMAALLIWILCLAAALILLRRRSKMPAVLVLALGSLIAGQLGGAGYNTIARERSGYYIAEAIRPLVKPDEPFYSVRMYEQTLPFYLKRTFTLVAYEDEMAFGIAQEPQRYIPDFGSFAKAWNRQPQALAIMPVDIYPLLQKMHLAMKVVYQDPQYYVVSKP